MPDQTRIVSPHYKPRTVRFDDGSTVVAPEDWELLPPGDAGLTRRVKAAGATWTVQQKKGRKTFSHGVWAPADTIARERKKIEAERATPEYARKMKKAAERRERDQTAYVKEFNETVVAFLAFDPAHAELEAQLAEAVTAHATPVGSGTVARTKRIDVNQRAEAAVIAWMRHQTTAYDHMKIARVKGKRREVRAKLAKVSRDLLDQYRRGVTVPKDCPLAAAISALNSAE